MIKGRQLIFLMLFLFTGTVQTSHAQVDTSRLNQAFRQADKTYESDPKAGFHQFQSVYEQALQHHDQVIEIKCLNLFTEYFWISRNFSEAIATGKKSISRAISTRNDALAGDACVLTGLVYYSKGDPLAAIGYYQKAILYYQKQPANKRLALAYMNLGVAERKAGRFETANTSYFKAADIFKQLGDQPGLGSVYTAIGNCYALMENFGRAIIYHKQALAIFTRLNDQAGRAQVLDNLGYAFKMLSKPDSAIRYLDQTLRIRAGNKDSSLLVIPLQNLGSAWKQKGDQQKTVAFIHRSLLIAAHYDMQEDLARGQADLAELYLAQKRYGEAEKILNLAENTAKKLKLADLQVTIADLNYQLQAALGHDRQALIYYQKRDLIRDSLLTEKKSRTIEDLELKYQTREKERNIADLHIRDRVSQKLLGEQRFSIAALIIAAALLLALLALAYYSFRTQRKGHLLVKELMKEVNHRTKNNLQILSSLLMLQIDNQEDENVKRALKETEVRLHTMNIMYSKLYIGQASTTVDMAEYLSSLLIHIQDGFSHEHRWVELVKDMDTIILPTDKAVLIGLVLNELISNSIRHAELQGVLILTVSLKQKNAHETELLIKDNGKPKKKNAKTADVSFGLRIVGLIVGQLEGKMETEPGNSYAYRIRFKI